MDPDKSLVLLIGGVGVQLASEMDWELTPRPIRMVLIARHGWPEALEGLLEQLVGKLG
jgi:hypothetical protein